MFDGRTDRVREDEDIMLKEFMWYNKLKEITPESSPDEAAVPNNRYLFQSESEDEK